MKKSIAIILCLLLVITSCFLLVGCAPTEELYKTDLVKKVKRDKDIYTVELNKKQFVDTLVLSETADKVTSFGVYGKNDDGSYTLIYKNDRIDKFRVCSLDGMVTNELRIEIFDKLGNTKINSIKAYNSTAEQRKTDFRVVEYLVTSDQKLEKMKDNPSFYEYFYNVNDIVLIGEIGVDESGKITYGEGKEDFAEDIANLNEIKENVKNPNMNIVVSVGLKGLASSSAKNQNIGIKDGINKNISTIVKNIAAFAEEFGINGIDFDWEYPQNGSQWKAYSKLIVELNSALAKSKRYITVALPTWGVKLSKDAVSAIKYVNLMTYDMFDERGEHASFYVSTKQGIDQFLRETKFSRNQIMLGLSFYGRAINKSENAWPDMNWDYKNNHESLGKWGNYIKDFEYTEDKMTKVCDAYINGFAMNRDKTTYAISSGLGGVMIFRMSCDAPAGYKYSLHNAVGEALKRGLKAKEPVAA
ncbi:MAG: glycoside hydrolase family 18 protein [Clostridia bacterium]|nr:glycoside hydrolase family 18 protein [Clostridia bacterium]